VQLAMSALGQQRTCTQAFVLPDAKAVGIHRAEIELRTGLPVVGGKLKRKGAIVQSAQALACDG